LRRFVALLRDRVRLDLRDESFSLLNHVKLSLGIVELTVTDRLLTGFGAPLQGVTNQLPARSFQFSAKVSF